MAADTHGLQRLVIRQQVLLKRCFTHQCTVPFFPIGIQQVFVAMWAHVVPGRHGLFYQCRILPHKIAGEKEGRLDIFLLQCLQNGRHPFGIFMTRKHQRQLFTCTISPNNCTLLRGKILDINLRTIRLQSPPFREPACRQGRGLGGFVFQCRQQINLTRSTIHGRFVGAVIAVIVVVHSQVALPFGVFIGLVKGKTNQPFKNGCVHGPINEAAINGIVF